MIQFLFILLAPASAVECVEPVHPLEVEDAIDTAERTFAELDEIGFRDRANQVSGLLFPCVTAPISPELASRAHRLIALQLTLAGDETGAHAAMRAAKESDPTSEIPSALLPAEHPLRQVFDTHEPATRGHRVPEPRIGSLAFDGTNTLVRPQALPTIVQLFDGKGTAITTQVLAPREPLPAYRAIPRQRNTLLVVMAGSFLLAGSAYGAALVQRGEVFRSAQQPGVTAHQLDGKRWRANFLTVSSGALLAAGIATGTGALCIGER